MYLLTVIAQTYSLGPAAFQQESSRKLFESNRTFIASRTTMVSPARGAGN